MRTLDPQIRIAPRLRASLIASLLVLWLLDAGGSAHATELSNFLASPLTSPGQPVTDVAIVGGKRVFTGFEVDPFSGLPAAKIYETSGLPGTTPVSITDLGFTVTDSFALSIARLSPTAWFATATQIVPPGDYRSYLFGSWDPASQTPVVGPAPTFDPNIEIWGVSEGGLAAGSIGRTTPILAQSDGSSVALPYAHPAELLGLDSEGRFYAGTAEPSAGADRVAIIFRELGFGLEYLDSQPGLIWDVEDRFAVGQRNDKATYWRRFGVGIWVPVTLEQGGVPVDGELRAIDHFGNGIAAGTANGEAIVVDLNTGEWFTLASLTSLPAGTLARVNGIGHDPLTGQIAFATEGPDLSGWDVVASLPAAPPPEAVPGPGIRLAAALALSTLLLLGLTPRTARSTRRPLR